MKKILIPIFALALSMPASAFGAELSPWAETEYKNVSSMGLVPETIVTEKLTGNVTREEFCDIIMNLYRKISGKSVNVWNEPFWDTASVSVGMAYNLGIVDGKEEHYFYPNDFITRQEMAKMVMKTVNAADKNANITLEEIEELCTFDDFNQTDDWATRYLAKTVKYGIINGVPENRIEPRGYATREQALAIINRAAEKFCDQKEYHSLPETSLYDGINIYGGFSFSWDSVPGAVGYRLILKDANEKLLKTYTANTNSFTISDMVYNRTYYVTVGAVMEDKTVVYGSPKEVFFGTTGAVGYVPVGLWEKQNKVFPDGKAFTTQAEADRNMELLTVPVWKIGTDGTKYSTTEKVMVNKNLADEVTKIFVNIYCSPEKFPIKNVGGYSFRQTAFGSVSHHSYGTCIDINFDENYYCYPNGQAITGSFWKPYENPYSVTPDGSVVSEFKKFGFTWGGDWTNLKDYMHFSYLGK